MALEAVGSIPITHPIHVQAFGPDVNDLTLGRGQAVRHGSLESACVGSNPTAPAIFMPNFIQQLIKKTILLFAA